MLRRHFITALLATTALAAAPATTPTSMPANQSTPQGAMKVLANAMEAGDAKQIKQVMATTNPTEDKLVDAMGDMSKAISHLRQAALKSFGEKGSTQLNGDPAAKQEEMNRIDNSKVEINGDTANVTVDPSQKTPLVLRKVNNQWKVPMSAMMGNTGNANPSQILEAIKMQSDVFEEVAKETEAGKYKTENDLRSALESQMMKAAISHAQASTRPATGAATQPAKQ